MPDDEQILDRIERIQVLNQKGYRAPHKPLLVLLVLGRMLAGHERLERYEDLAGPLTDLLKRFGPPRKRHHPEYPFGYLRTDQLWEIPGAEVLPNSKGTLHPGGLIQHSTRGGFPEAVYKRFQSNPVLVQQAAQTLLDGHFPRSLHDDIGAAVSIPAQPVVFSLTKRPQWNPSFRGEVLRAYERRCAVCEYDIRMDDELLGLEAAHIKWRAIGGPDIVPNGLALCTLHHKAFDRGALGLTATHEGFNVVISGTVHGQSKAVALLRDFHDEPIRLPQSRAFDPQPEFVEWHRRQVFRGPALDRATRRT